MGRESHMFRSENGYGNQEAGFAPLLKYLKKIAPPPPPTLQNNEELILTQLSI